MPVMIELSKPITVKDKEVAELALDFEALTGADLATIERRVRAEDPASAALPTLLNTMPYQAAVVAKVVGVPVEEINAMPAKDFRNVTMAAANFLLA